MTRSNDLAALLATSPRDLAAIEAFAAAALGDQHDQPLFECVHEEVVPSLATAAPAGRGMFGSFANHRKNRRTTYWSDLERKCIHCLLADPTIKDVWEQPPAMTYLKRDGTIGTHRWDALAVADTGERQYVYMKPLAKLMQPTNNRYAEFLYLASWADPRVASSARVMSEWNLDPAEVDAAEVFNQALASPRPALAPWVLEQVIAAGGRLLVDSICRLHVSKSAASPGIRPDVLFHQAMSEAYWAVLWLLAVGELSKADAGFISTFSHVQLARSA